MHSVVVWWWQEQQYAAHLLFHLARCRALHCLRSSNSSPNPLPTHQSSLTPSDNCDCWTSATCIVHAFILHYYECIACALLLLPQLVYIYYVIIICATMRHWSDRTRPPTTACRMNTVNSVLLIAMNTWLSAVCRFRFTAVVLSAIRLKFSTCAFCVGVWNVCVVCGSIAVHATSWILVVRGYVFGDRCLLFSGSPYILLPIHILYIPTILNGHFNEPANTKKTTYQS